MDNTTITFGLIGLSVLLLIITIVVWLSGRKKATSLSLELSALENEKKDLKGNLAVLEEKCNRIEPLEQEVSSYKTKQEGMQKEITKLSTDLAREAEKGQSAASKCQELKEKLDAAKNDLAAEIEKNKKLASLSNELAEKESTLSELQSSVDQSKDTISELDNKVQEEKKKSEEQATIISKLKSLFA